MTSQREEPQREEPREQEQAPIGIGVRLGSLVVPRHRRQAASGSAPLPGRRGPRGGWRAWCPWAPARRCHSGLPAGVSLGLKPAGLTLLRFRQRLARWP